MLKAKVITISLFFFHDLGQFLKMIKNHVYGWQRSFTADLYVHEPNFEKLHF